jgi:peptide/nickel transport system ATP-binding protein
MICPPRASEEQSIGMIAAPALIELVGLRVAFDGVPVLHDIDLIVRRGEAVGMVGESGSGKSVTWLAALGLLPRRAHISGSVRLDGRELVGATPDALADIRGGRIGLIFQDPVSALNPVHRVGAQIAEAISLHRGLSGAAARAEARRLLDQVGIPDPGRRIDAYPHELSGGQNQRVMIAMALAGEPDLLIADEPTTALDTTIQAQILDLIDRLRRDTGMALVLISHDLSVVGEVCERIAVLYGGRIVEDGPTAELLGAPAHPYTKGLLAAVPPLVGPRSRLVAIPGNVARPGDLPPGCAFAPRCRDVVATCSTQMPGLREVAPGHRAACLRLAGAAS